MIEDDDAIARVLRPSGRRADVPAERAARVRAAVHDEWRAHTRRSTVRLRVLAAVGLLAVGSTLAIRIGGGRSAVPALPPKTVAQIERVEGETTLALPGGSARPAAVRLGGGGAVQTGEWVQTGRDGRCALRLADGTSLRLDTGGRLRMMSPTIVELTGGTLYFDTGRSAAGLEVRTPLGTIHDIGTQFEVRLQNSSLRLRVRTGLAELRRGADVVAARAGTELTLADGATTTRAVATFGPEWGWTAHLATPFDTEGQPLAAFLEYLTHEYGWTLQYADPALARDASSTILHGSIRGLQPEEALAVALTTSGLSYRFRDGGEVLVFRNTEAR
jgi:ferric-dicitrate binding protein FerR (iron transport regulator)